MTSPDRKLQERLLLSRPVPGDRLMLADEVLLAALDGSQPLSPGELAALKGSPLTLRRFRQLSIERRAAKPGVANDPVWRGSGGMLRAASTSAALESLVTDDGYWTLHFVADEDGWQVILALEPAAPFAARLLRERPQVRVTDGGGGIVVQGQLDADGECERRWAFPSPPAEHFQQHGARFSVAPMAV
ncbi:hypothetical protein [Massilia endophytica]|uniref:hypothetical protein n=1 Tax=Massilia endophytica TaxID=2899220 RepID=UPI001E48CC88|nr:hypothetical protein [Massilia endophytica]UGQ48307.1 hypothetical protein LSQ66_07530 [Massilia endophytica]